MKRATAYRKKNLNLIFSLYRMDGVAWFTNITTLSIVGDQPEQLTLTIREALAQSTTGHAIRPYKETSETIKEFLHSLGIRSFSALVSGSKLVSISQTDDLAIFVPSTQAGPRSGYTPNEDAKITCPIASPDLSLTLLQAFALSR